MLQTGLTIIDSNYQNCAVSGRVGRKVAWMRLLRKPPIASVTEGIGRGKEAFRHGCREVFFQEQGSVKKTSQCRIKRNERAIAWNLKERF